MAVQSAAFPESFLLDIPIYYGMGLPVKQNNTHPGKRSHYWLVDDLPPRQTGRRRFDRPFDGPRAVRVVEPLRARAS